MLPVARGEFDQAQLKAAGRHRYLPAKRFYRIWNLLIVLHRMLAKLMRRDD